MVTALSVTSNLIWGHNTEIVYIGSIDIDENKNGIHSQHNSFIGANPQ